MENTVNAPSGRATRSGGHHRKQVTRSTVSGSAEVLQWKPNRAAWAGSERERVDSVESHGRWKGPCLQTNPNQVVPNNLNDCANQLIRAIAGWAW